jgi:hypothetical protein
VCVCVYVCVCIGAEVCERVRACACDSLVCASVCEFFFGEVYVSGESCLVCFVRWCVCVSVTCLSFADDLCLCSTLVVAPQQVRRHTCCGAIEFTITHAFCICMCICICLCEYHAE